jgi:hypothetical protein
MKKIIILISVISILQIPTLTASACSSTKGALKKTGGVISGLVVAPIVGLARGFGRGQKLGTNYTAELIGGSDIPAGRAAAFLTGGLLNGALGAGVGLIKGGYEGIHYGIKKPFSKENYSLTGTSFTDYPLLSN